MKIKEVSRKVKTPIRVKTIQIDDDEGYKWRNTRIDFPTGTIVICEWMYPNQGKIAFGI